MTILRERLNPVDELKRLGLPHDHVTFDPDLKRGRYYIRRGSTHDGTGSFTLELLSNALKPIATQTSYCTRDDVEPATITGVRYRVGWLRRAAVFGMVDLPCGRLPGQHESVRLEVVAEYVPAPTLRDE